MKRVGIFPNLDKEGAAELAGSIARWLIENSATPVLTIEGAASIGRPELGRGVSAWGKDVDFVIVLGGDGTLLNAAASLAPAGVPMVGVNLGRLGFLTELETTQIFDALPKLLRGDYTIEERMMLRVSVGHGARRDSFLALNEVTISKGPFARLIQLEVSIAGHLIDQYDADGLIVATPTGSTAYSLSAGGPIVSPELKVCLITPICPHSLYSRSIVVPADEEIKVEVTSVHQDTAVTIDGQRLRRLEAGDTVVVSRAREVANLMRLRDWSFYDVLRAKLKEH
ncbi:MAG TPA: NAD(+)/NADH kinase [Firmicutes bacterium]|nr:NAD(+)/NADH kinase [Bacillota bacterium]